MVCTITLYSVLMNITLIGGFADDGDIQKVECISQ
jgi:hypothetical protein